MTPSTRPLGPADVDPPVEAARPRRRWDGMLAISAYLAFPPGRGADGLRAFQAVTGPIRAEEGCQEFGAFACPDDADTVFVFEVWASQDALARHFQTDHVAVLGAELTRLEMRSEATTGYEVTSSRQLTEG